MEWRAPGRRNAEPFPEDPPEIGGAAVRYPGQKDTEDYFSETEDSVETLAGDSNDDMRLSD